MHANNQKSYEIIRFISIGSSLVIYQRKYTYRSFAMVRFCSIRKFSFETKHCKYRLSLTWCRGHASFAHWCIIWFICFSQGNDTADCETTLLLAWFQVICNSCSDCCDLGNARCARRDFYFLGPSITLLFNKAQLRRLYSLIKVNVSFLTQ